MTEAIRKSLLLCDDETDLAEELGEFFAESGWVVRICNTGGEAERLLVEGLAPDCLMTDLRLGDMDGSRLVATARSLPAAIRPRLTVVITGNILGSASKENLGVDILRLKPIDPAMLAQEMEDMLFSKMSD
ncbi:response regulator [Pseudoxanthobacter sp. M-2]|uniref:response regulator n=1 Tax=Pseudoxanthobacter sp. M-2 TaxID=3078754 RepID=UPI0038FCFDE3